MSNTKISKLLSKIESTSDTTEFRVDQVSSAKSALSKNKIKVLSSTTDKGDDINSGTITVSNEVAPDTKLILNSFGLISSKLTDKVLDTSIKGTELVYSKDPIVR